MVCHLSEYIPEHSLLGWAKTDMETNLKWIMKYESHFLHLVISCKTVFFILHFATCSFSLSAFFLITFHSVTFLSVTFFLNSFLSASFTSWLLISLCLFNSFSPLLHLSSYYLLNYMHQFLVILIYIHILERKSTTLKTFLIYGKVNGTLFALNWMCKTCRSTSVNYVFQNNVVPVYSTNNNPI